MKKKENYLLTIVLAVITLLFIVMLRTVDVAPVGPEGTRVGFSRLNMAFHDLTGVQMVWYRISAVLGYIAIAAGLLFVAAGVMQMIRRKGLAKVDRPIMGLTVLYAVTAGLYVLFEFVIINYRPVILPGATEPEASFPSSHTMLLCVIGGSLFMMFGLYVREGRLRKRFQLVCAAVAAVGVTGRLLSGVHWLTDIIGAILISSVLLTAFSNFLKKKR